MKAKTWAMKSSWMVLTLLLIVIQTNPALAYKDHSGYFKNGFDGAKTCLMCHGSKAGEVMDSVHYQ